jgi:hypothetical protein
MKTLKAYLVLAASAGALVAVAAPASAAVTLSTHSSNVPSFCNVKMSPSVQWLGGCG